MAGKFSLKIPDFHVAYRDLLHAVNLRHGTHSFTSLLQEGVLRIFFTLKSPDGFGPGLNPRTLGSKGQHNILKLEKMLLQTFLIFLFVIVPLTVECQ
jgi:hypothetical protein